MIANFGIRVISFGLNGKREIGQIDELNGEDWSHLMSDTVHNTKFILSLCMAIKCLLKERANRIWEYKGEDRDMLMYWLGKELIRNTLGGANIVYSIYILIEELAQDTFISHESNIRFYINLLIVTSFVIHMTLFMVFKVIGALSSFFFPSIIVYKRKKIIDWY